MAEYEHQFNLKDEVQMTLVVSEMPKDVKREFPTGVTKLFEITEKLSIIINEMVPDDGPVPKDLGSVGMQVARTTHSDQDASNNMSYDNVCAIAGTIIKLAKEHTRKDQTERANGHRDDGGQNKQGSRDRNLIGTVTKDSIRWKQRQRQRQS